MYVICRNTWIGFHAQYRLLVSVGRQCQNPRQKRRRIPRRLRLQHARPLTVPPSRPPTVLEQRWRPETIPCRQLTMCCRSVQTALLPHWTMAQRLCVIRPPTDQRRQTSPLNFLVTHSHSACVHLYGDHCRLSPCSHRSKIYDKCGAGFKGGGSGSHAK